VGSPISLARIRRFAKSVQLTAALAGDHAAAITIAAVLLTSAAFNLNIGISCSVHQNLERHFGAH
jgi:hypothetical protein